MSFNCVSKYGLVGGGVFLPYDVQKLIEDIWLRMRYREMYGDVVKQLIREIGISGSVCKRRMIVELRNRFKYYGEAQLIWLLRMFAHSIYWHSSTWIDEDRVLNSPFSAISQLSYQDLLAFHYYAKNYPTVGWSERNLFTNSWNNPPHTYETYSMYTNHWVRPCDSHT